MNHFALLGLTVALVAAFAAVPAAQTVQRALRFQATTPEEAKRWQQLAREKLFALMMGGKKPQRVPFDAKVIKREEPEGANYTLEELTLQTLPDRRVHCWLAMPQDAKSGATPGMLALHGHGGTGEQIVRGQSPYWYGKALAERGYAVIAPDIGSHELQHKDWTLMGERTWDALVCLDYLCSLPPVNKERVGVAGLSLGGETTMYVAALDERLKVAVSSGWLTTVENMKNGHCPCWNFSGLEENFDFSDIFSLVAPRALVLENGRQEVAPGGFPVDIARAALKEIQAAYKAFNAEDKVLLDVHDGGHVFHGKASLEWIEKALKH